jgi:hypothetical protein
LQQQRVLSFFHKGGGSPIGQTDTTATVHRNRDHFRKIKRKIYKQKLPHLAVFVENTSDALAMHTVDVKLSRAPSLNQFSSHIFFIVRIHIKLRRQDIVISCAANQRWQKILVYELEFFASF